MHIDDYSFGRIVIDKITYTSDLNHLSGKD